MLKCDNLFSREHLIWIGVLALGFLLPACFTLRVFRGPGDPEAGVRVRWHGHSCFTIEDSTGRQFLLDPFNDEAVGYRLAWTNPDAVLVTHEHFDHTYLERTTGYELLKSTGVHTVAGVEVSGFLADHDDEGGRRHGTTRFYVWEMGGLCLATLGDMGQTVLRPDQREALKGVDILFLPVGGKTTVDGAQAAALVKAIGPRAVVPMHYGNKKVRFHEFDRIDAFLSFFRNVKILPSSEFQFRRGNQTNAPTVYVPKIP